MTPGYNWVAPEIFPLLYSYLGALLRVSGFATLPIQSIPPAIVRLSKDLIGVTLVSLPGYCKATCRGYYVGVLAK